MIPVRFLFHAKYKTLMNLRLERIESIVLFILSLLLILKISFPIFIFPFVFSILSFFEVKIKKLHFISINFVLFSFFSYMQGYYFIPTIILLLILFYTEEFDKNEILKSFIFCFVFLFFYCTYGMTYLSMFYGLLAGSIFCIVPFYASIATILILALNPIEYRFAGEVVVLSLLLYGLYPVFKERLHLDKTLVYYQASFFLLIGAFLSLEKSLFYFLVLLLPYILVMKETIIFDSEKILKITFSILGFWIILLKFNDLGYLGLFFSFSAGMLIYLLNDIIEED
ncbi:MAG TPA: hypothetical protein ENI52_01975 [Thermoplasmata archaeon]|nr:hypothetical protein [Thermoplasmata archaeon]